MIQNFFAGITAYGKALSHISRYGLWGYVLLPGLLSLLIGGIVFYSAFSLSDNLGDLIDNLWKWQWGSEVASKIAQVFGGLIIAALGLLVFRQIVMVALGPFMSKLSEKVESQLTGRQLSHSFTARQIIKDMSRGLHLAIRNIIRELSATLFLLLLGLIPLFTPFTTALIFILQSYYVGFGNMDFTLERHKGFRESVSFVRKNRPLAIGNGAVFILLLFTFIGFFFALPLGTVAATLETVKRLPPQVQKGELV